jgi:hypothetical protein
VCPEEGRFTMPMPPGHQRDLRAAMAAALEKLGVAVKYHHHEVGGPGQHEIEVVPDDAGRLGDGTMQVKYVVKNLARAWGKVATFMPKPFFGEAGSGMHVHMQLFKGDLPVFAGSGKAYAGLSDPPRSPVHGGKPLPFGRAFRPCEPRHEIPTEGLSAVYEAPIAVAFATANRSAVIRIRVTQGPRGAPLRVPLQRRVLQPLPPLCRPPWPRPRRCLQEDRSHVRGFGPLEENTLRAWPETLELLPIKPGRSPGRPGEGQRFPAGGGRVHGIAASKTGFP